MQNSYLLRLTIFSALILWVGLDGRIAAQPNPSGPIYVSMTGADSNPGTTTAPMRNIGAAIDAAASYVPQRDVYIAGGVYNETVVLKSGVNIYGSRDPAQSWSYQVTTPTTINGASTAVYAQALSVGVTLNNLFITSVGGLPTDSIAMLVRNNSVTVNLNGTVLTPGV
ncbi:DUF1565 domain-containing protein, partial [Candidatus Sumerlaeota bacterium]|nr:DUF1565 domain-containing protein [Candidatus Sumerlaeota bacterium]